MPSVDLLDKVRSHLLKEPPSFVEARAELAKSDDTTTTLSHLVVVEDDELVFEGSLVVDGTIYLHVGAMLWVLGDLRAERIYSGGLDYSAVVVGGKTCAKMLRTGGEVLALAGIEADVVWGVYNDYATYAPTVICESYITEDRNDTIGRITAKNRISAKSEIAEIFPALYPDGYEHEDSRTFEARERQFFVGSLPSPVAGASTPEEEAALRAALTSSAHEERSAAWRTIRRRHLVSMVPVLAEIIRERAGTKFSVMEEIALLGDLGAGAELVWVAREQANELNCSSWIWNAFARAGWETAAEHIDGRWQYRARANASDEWLVFY